MIINFPDWSPARSSSHRFVCSKCPLDYAPNHAEIPDEIFLFSGTNIFVAGSTCWMLAMQVMSVPFLCYQILSNPNCASKLFEASSNFRLLNVNQAPFFDDPKMTISRLNNLKLDSTLWVQFISNSRTSDILFMPSYHIISIIGFWQRTGARYISTISTVACAPHCRYISLVLVWVVSSVFVQKTVSFKADKIFYLMYHDNGSIKVISTLQCGDTAAEWQSVWPPKHQIQQQLSPGRISHKRCIYIQQTK